MDNPQSTGLFSLLREITPGVTREDWDAGAVRSLVATMMYQNWFGYTMEWIRSYWQPQGDWGMCIYRAPSAETIEWFNRECSFSALEIRRVEEQAGAGGVRESLFVLDGPDDAVQRLVAAIVAADGRFVRSFRDDERRTTVAIVSSGSGSNCRAEPGVIVRPIVELLPADYN